MSLVMVIDDMAIVREPIAASLREQGYRTVCAAEGREALATVRAETPDLILLDLSMPGMDGMDVLRAFRRENATARTPVILLTASADKQHVVEAARLGVRDYLLKSKFSFPELLVRVRKYLNPLKPREDVISSATRSLSANVAAADAGATASVATCAKVSSTMTQIPRLLTREQCIERATEALAGRALSGVIAQVINLAASPRGDLSQLAGMIGRDPMLSGRVLQAANNTCYASARGPVSTLPEAVRNIGCSAVRSIASTFGVFDAMPPSEADGFNPIRSWQHSLAVAMLCERFAPEAERARAYLIGLCHDLGEILFHTHFGVEYRQLLQVELTTGKCRDDLQREMLGITHGELVKTIVRCLGLPDTIREPIEAYHAKGAIAGDGGTLARLLRVADLYANGMSLASSDQAPIAPITVAEARVATGHDHPQRPDAAAVCSEIFSLTSLLARLQAPERNHITSASHHRRPVRIFLARDPSFSALDPVLAAMEALAEVTLSDALPKGQEADGHHGLVVVSRNMSGKGFTSSDLEKATTRFGASSLPHLWLSGRIDVGSCAVPATPWPTPMKIFADFVSALTV